MSRRAGIESSNILDGPRKRLRGSNNDASADDAANAASSSSTAAAGSNSSSTAGMGAIERRIHSLSVEHVAQHGQRLMDTVMQAIDPADGAPLHEFFLELPDAEEYPDYYEIIKRPMALEQIQSKLDQRTYASLPDVKHDFETICNNAKRYNLRDTPVWLKAKELHSLVKITYVQIVESLPEPSAAPAAPPAAASAAAAQSDSTAEAEATPGRSKRILLRSTKSQQKLNDQVQPKTEPQDQAAVLPMPSASSSQPSASQAPPKAEQPQPSTVQPQTNVPATPARQQSQQPYTAAGTPSSAADDDDDADGEDDRWDLNDADSSKLTKGGLLDGRKRPGKRGKRLKATLRQLVHDLRRVIGTRGYPLVQNFDALPDRHQTPEYYQVIQKPICLRDIEHRVFEKEYINAHALFVDLELMLNNAMTFYSPETPIWQDAHEIRQYFEREAIPSLIQDGFTLEKDDVRQSALPLHLAANSTIEAHKAAYKMIVAKTGIDGGASQSPEPSSRGGRLGSAGVAGSPALPGAQGLPAGSPVAFGSPSPAVQPNVAPMMSTPGAQPAGMMGNAGMPMSMPMSMPMAPPMSTPTSMSPMAPMAGMPGMPAMQGMPPMGMMGSPGRPMQFPGTTMTPTASPARPAATPEGRRPVGRPPGKGTPSRSNPYPFLERRIGPGRPKKHEAAARQAAIAAHEEMLRKQALQQQQEELAQQQQAAVLAAQPVPQWQQQQLLQQQLQQQQLYLQQQQRQQEQQAQRQQQQQQRRQQQQQQQQQAQQQAYLEQQRQLQHAPHPHAHGLSPSPAQQQMLPPGTPSPFGSGMVVAEPPSPVKRKEAVLPAEPKEALPFEGLEDRTPLISNFAIGMEVEEPDGQTLAVPPLEIKNGFATQHTLQIPPNASSITIEFPLRMLSRKAKSKPAVKAEDAIDPALADGDVAMHDAAPANGAASQAEKDASKAAEGDGKEEGSLTWPWQPELSFNGKQTAGSWTAADALIDPALLEEAQDEDDGEDGYTTSIGYSYCKVRLLPKRGINVFEITVRPDANHAELSQVPPERYSIYFC